MRITKDSQYIFRDYFWDTSFQFSERKNYTVELLSKDTHEMDTFNQDTLCGPSYVEVHTKLPLK